MFNFEEIGKKISQTGKAAGEKAKQVSEIAKLNIKLGTAEKEADELLLMLGKKAYEASKGNADSEFFGECEEIAAKLDSVKEIKAQIHALKGVVICGKCGAEVDLENEFCGKCGAKVEKPEIKPEPEVIDHEDDVDASACGEETAETAETADGVDLDKKEDSAE
mgnify:FL=1